MFLFDSLQTQVVTRSSSKEQRINSLALPVNAERYSGLSIEMIPILQAHRPFRRELNLQDRPNRSFQKYCTRTWGPQYHTLLSIVGRRLPVGHNFYLPCETTAQVNAYQENCSKEYVSLTAILTFLIFPVDDSQNQPIWVPGEVMGSFRLVRPRDPNDMMLSLLWNQALTMPFLFGLFQLLLPMLDSVCAMIVLTH